MARSDLRRRLERFDRTIAGPAAAAGIFRMDVDARLRRLIDLGIDGATQRGEGDTMYLRIEAEVDRELWPGPPLRCVDAELWQRLRRGGQPTGDHWVVLDTETTGLQSGTGTLVFLVGALHWTDQGARLVQYLLPTPAGEKRMLADLENDLSTSDALVSFNGSSFDLPRLRTRALLSGLDPAFLRRPHLDLVHPARRIASSWLDDCRLGSLESQWLGRTRVDDISGSEIPAIYRSWLVEGEASGLLAVLRHNRQDVENLMALTALLAAVYGDGDDPFLLPPVSQLALGRALMQRGHLAAARLRFGSAAEKGRGHVARRALAEYVRLLKRQGEWKDAESLLRGAVKRWPAWIWARVEIAKIEEHRGRDFEAALRTVEASRRILGRQALLAGGQDRRYWSHELEHRRKRLLRRKMGTRG